MASDSQKLSLMVFSSLLFFFRPKNLLTTPLSLVPVQLAGNKKEMCKLLVLFNLLFKEIQSQPFPMSQVTYMTQFNFAKEKIFRVFYIIKGKFFLYAKLAFVIKVNLKDQSLHY